MVEGLAPLARRFYGHAEAFHRGALPHVLVEVLGAELALEARLLGQRGAAHYARVVGGHITRADGPAASSRGERTSRRLDSAVNLVEEIFRRGDAGLAAERGGDELGRLARTMPELLGEDLEDRVAESILVHAPGRGRPHLGRQVGTREGELGHLRGELGHDVLGLLWPDAGQPPKIRLVLSSDGGGDLRDGGGQRARGHQGPHVLHGDQLLEELLVEPGVESDEDGRRLVLRGVVVDLERHLGGAVAVAGDGAAQGALDHRRQHHLVADAARLDHHAILVLAPDPAPDQSDHWAARARGVMPVTLARPVTARPRASATCEGRGRSRRPSSDWTPRWTWALPAEPLPVMARFTSEGARAVTPTPSWRAARYTTPRA